ncbi:MAG: Gfo/Idh/MocA family oxidoreductase [Acidobacteriota bacterium]
MKQEDRKSQFDRRDFIGSVAVAGAGLMLTRCAKSYPKLTFLDAAPDGVPLKAGLVGCGGRGTGAAQDFLKAGPNLQITALADVFEDRVAECRKTLEEKAAQEVSADRCFVGFDAYKKVIDSDVDVVLLATPPHFRPEHFEAAVNAKKHVFMEKPVAVDPLGVRSILASAQRAKTFNISVVTGTQRRHQRDYLETYNRVANGAIGRIVSARCYWNQSQLWSKPRQQGWSDMEAMIRDWVSWCWLSGDHIVEQHVHNLDVMSWFLGAYPTKAVAMGARMRRLTGDQYDFFAVDYALENGLHIQSTCRQIDGCANNISEFLVGTEGSTNCRNKIFDKEGKEVWRYRELEGKPEKEAAQESDAEPETPKISPYVQEHIDLVNAIRTNQPINEAENTAKATLVAIMGRISAYTGQEVTWDQVMQSGERLGPTEYAMGPVPIQARVPLPGTEPHT